MTHPPGDVREVTTDVAVIGAGPCGITMANLLAVYGVRAVVIDAQPGIYEYPRAVGIDDESLRTYQSIGIVGRLLEDIVQNTPIRYYTSWGRLMAHVEPSVRPFGWPRQEQLPPAAVRGGAAGKRRREQLGRALARRPAGRLRAGRRRDHGGHRRQRRQRRETAGQIPRRDRWRPQHRAENRGDRDDRGHRPLEVAGRRRRRRRARRALLGRVLRPGAARPHDPAARTGTGGGSSSSTTPTTRPPSPTRSAC